MWTWFKGTETLEELRKKYTGLLKKHHPDNGDNVSEMQEINREYGILFDMISKKGNGGQEESPNQEEDREIRKILDEIISFDITIEIIGSWIWCFGCYAYRDRLKSLGFKYAPKKKAWAWHYGEYRRYHKHETSLDDIRAKYGSQEINRQNMKQYSLN